MNSVRSPQECNAAVVRRVSERIQRGLCAECALIIVSDALQITYGQAKRIWSDHQSQPTS